MGKKARTEPLTEAAKLEKKLRDIDANFVDGAQSMTSEEMKANIVKLAQQDEEIRTAKREDADIVAARDSLKVMNQSYTEPLKINNLKTRFLVARLEERGQG